MVDYKESASAIEDAFIRFSSRQEINRWSEKYDNINKIIHSDKRTTIAKVNDLLVERLRDE